MIDFEIAICRAGSGDFLFLDPPYVAASKTANFAAYSAGGFGPAEQARLAELLKSIPCRWLLTNRDTEATRALYDPWFVESVEVDHSVSGKGSGRGVVRELLVSNRPILLDEAA